jgi:hypothetical protein
MRTSLVRRRANYIRDVGSRNTSSCYKEFFTYTDDFSEFDAVGIGGSENRRRVFGFRPRLESKGTTLLSTLNLALFPVQQGSHNSIDVEREKL